MKNSTKNFIKKLDDVSLESVSGGGVGDVLFEAGGGIAILSIVSGIGCEIANTVCQYKAKSKRDQGNIKSAEKLEKAARILGPVSFGVSAGGVIVGGAIMLIGVSKF